MPKRKSSAGSSSAKTSEPEKLAAFQSFVPSRISRSQVQNASYNPRKISSYAREKLKGILKRHGMVSPITWNRRTGNVVGGHQRLSILDQLEKSGGYLLDVSEIDVDEKQEREINVALNNYAAQGEFDGALLADLIRNDGIDIAATGFDGADIQILVDDPDLSAIFQEAGPEAVVAKKDATDLGALKARRADVAKEMKRRGAADFYAVVIFRDGDEQAAFMESVGAKRDDVYIDGHKLAHYVGLNVGTS